MKNLVINCGSTTIKFQLIDMEQEEVIAKGRCDMIGYEKGSNIIYSNLRDEYSHTKEVPMPTHKEAMEILIADLRDPNYGVISNLDEISAVGHRVAHGGDNFSRAVLVTDEVISEIAELGKIAPLHNPGALMGIRAIKEIAPNLKNVVVFDTAFHQTIPKYNYMYAIDQKYYQKYRIRKYGFHGTSYKYVLDRLTTKYLKKPKSNVNAVICHIGGGASVCAIKNGESYDTSMGFTPLEGLIMETRSGDLDPAAVIKIMKEENLTPDEMEKILNKESGRLGICGIGDQREMIKAADSGNEDALLARRMQSNRTKKYIGSYMAQLNRVDAIVFTGGIGENNAEDRSLVLSDMEYLGIEIDEEKNSLNILGKEGIISTEASKIPVFVIPTNEEVEIAKQTKAVVSEC
ncbi:MAG: acetate kinase [Clostridia bacterium]